MEEAPAADPDRTRFLVELEFVQSLANPHYLGWLAAGSLPALASAHFFIPPYAGESPGLAGVIARRLLPAMSLGETDSAARSAEGYLRDGKFIRYLDYLQYWKEPQYTK